MSNVGAQAAGRRKPVVRFLARLATNIRFRLDIKVQLNPKKQILKKHMSKTDMLKERAVDKAVDDLLRDDDAQTEHMDVVADPVTALIREAGGPTGRAKTGAVAHPIAVLKTKKMSDDTSMKIKMAVADPIHAPETKELDLTDLLMLANHAITHKALKPYDV